MHKNTSLKAEPPISDRAVKDTCISVWTYVYRSVADTTAISLINYVDEEIFSVLLIRLDDPLVDLIERHVQEYLS